MKTTPFLVSVLALVIAGCTSVDLPKKSAAGDETFRFYNPDVENLPKFADRDVEAMATIQDELRKRLTDAGLKEVASGEQADLIVSYLIVVQNNTVTTAIGQYYASSGVEIIEAAHKYAQKNDPKRKFLAGTVVIDIFDVAKRKLIYRDFSTKEVLPDQTLAQRQQEVRDATDKAIAKFVE